MYAAPDTLQFGRGTLASGADLSSYSGYCGKFSTGTVVLGTDNAACGIILDGGTKSGDRVAFGFGHCYALAGGTITIGTLVSCNSSGLLITAVSGDTPIGFALSAAANSGDVVEVFIYGAVDEAVA